MSSQPAFCAYCGARLTPGSAFCTSCGQRVVAAPQEVAPAYPPPGPPPPPAMGPAPAAPTAPPTPRRRSSRGQASRKTKASGAKGKSVGTALLLTLVGVLLVIMGLRGPVLEVAGASAPGVITDVTQDTSSEDSDYTYNISYSFRTSDGEQHNGITKRSNVLNAGTLPAPGSAINVRYLPSLPLVNAPSGEATLSIGSIMMLVIGVGLTVFAWRR